MRNKYTLLYIGLIIVGTLLTACHRHTVYHQYEHIPVEGWEHNDTLSFMVPAISASDNYLSELGVRINSNYPYTNLNIIVEQTILPNCQTRRDTLSCSLIDEKGTTKGTGVNYYQYLFPIATERIAQGDSLLVNIRHNMRDDILQGISDVGFRLSRAKKKPE